MPVARKLWALTFVSQHYEGEPEGVLLSRKTLTRKKFSSRAPVLILEIEFSPLRLVVLLPWHGPSGPLL